MHLVEEGKIEMDSRVFGPGAILNDSVYLTYKDDRVEDISIQHLLTHRAGWSRYYGDPMFMPHVIGYALIRKLNYKPGTRYSYSNLGYAILGEVIERVTGMDYDDYIQFAILNPLAIHDMRIGKGYYKDRSENEVKYYEVSGSRDVLAFDSHDTYVPRVYGGNDIELLGAAGGWLASPAEILKLVVAIDGFNTSPDLLMPETIQTMTKTKRSRYDMIGWKGTDGSGTWWRTGTLTGTSALLVRQNNGISWIIVTNTTTWKRSRIHSETSRTMFRAISSVKEWPEYDLFDYQRTSLIPSSNLTRMY